MKVLVTGASGFVGQSLIPILKKRGIKVVGVTRQVISSKKDLLSIPDFTAERVWSEHLQGCDAIIHLAARAHKLDENPADSFDEYIHANVNSTLNLANEAINAGVKRFVYVSSIGVLGDETVNEAFTERSPIRLNSNYSHSKWLAEQGLIELFKKSTLELVIIRPPLVYGPKNPGNMLKLLNLVSSGMPLPFNSIKNARSFIYIGNLIDALILCATHPRASGQTYLVSDGEDVSTPILIKNIAMSINKPCLLFVFPLSVMRFFAALFNKSNTLNKLIQSLVVDSSKIRQELNWKPPFTMAEGLKVTADWYRKSLENKRS